MGQNVIKQPLIMVDICYVCARGPFFYEGLKMSKKAFTLVELMIIVAILGIMAAIVIPTLQGHSVQAKESAAKDNLRTIRSQVELYKMQHNGTNPGYAGGLQINIAFLPWQLKGCTKLTGEVNMSTVPSGEYVYGPYLKSIPDNPFNGMDTILYVAEADAFSVEANGTSSGWLYKKETGEFVLNYSGTDGEGVNYYEY